MATERRRPARRASQRQEREPEEWRGYVAFGSDEHATLLGLNDPHQTEERKAELKEAHEAKEFLNPALDRKVPVTRENYAADDRYGPGDPIIDGWTRRGR